MKAIEINGQIKTYDTLPKSWGNVLGGFNLLSDNELKSYGFYNISIPSYNEKTQYVGNLYFNSASETFTKDVSDKSWDESLSELKKYQINIFNKQINYKLSETDWYIVRNQETGADIPADITTARQALRNQSKTVENEINALTTKEDVMSYNLPIII